MRQDGTRIALQHFEVAAGESAPFFGRHDQQPGPFDEAVRFFLRDRLILAVERFVDQYDELG